MEWLAGTGHARVDRLPTTGTLVTWPDGTLAYVCECFKEYDDPRPARDAAWTVTSRDGGRTFSAPLLVAQHPEHQVDYWDQRLCSTGVHGEFVALFWTYDRRHQMDLRVHHRRAQIRGTSIEGTPITKTSIPGQTAAPLVLEDATCERAVRSPWTCHGQRVLTGVIQLREFAEPAGAGFIEPSRCFTYRNRL